MRGGKHTRFDAKAGDQNTTPGDIDITVASRHREKFYHSVAIRLATTTSLTKKQKFNESAVPVSSGCPRVYQLQQASEI